MSYRPPHLLFVLWDQGPSVAFGWEAVLGARASSRGPREDSYRCQGHRTLKKTQSLAQGTQALLGQEAKL